MHRDGTSGRPPDNLVGRIPQKVPSGHVGAPREHILHAVLPGLAQALDATTLGRLPAQFATRTLARRIGDQLWRVEFLDRDRPSLLVLLEFQATPDPRMTVRVDHEKPQAYHILNVRATDTSRLPADNLIRALIELETAVRSAQVIEVARRLSELDEEEEESMLAETVKRWTEEWYQEGRQEGAVATLRDLVTLKFGAEVAAQLPALLEGLFEADRIEVVAAAVIQCDTGEEFIARTRGAPPQS